LTDRFHPPELRPAMLRETQVKKLAAVYLVCGAALFLFAMYNVANVYANTLNRLDPKGNPEEPARRVEVKAPPPAAVKRFVPAAIPQMPIY